MFSGEIKGKGPKYLKGDFSGIVISLGRLFNY